MNPLTPIASDAPSPSQGQPKRTLGRDDFLRLLLTQLEHQDPLNPLKGTEFTAQLAQFSSLDQLIRIQEGLSSLVEVQELGMRVQALGLMGQEVVAQGDRLHLFPEGPAGFQIRLAQDAAQVRVLILDLEGNPVRRLEWDGLKAGSHRLSWDGRNQAGVRMPPGTYRYEVLALDARGQEIPTQSLVRGQVQGVRFEEGEPVLEVEGLSIPLRFVQEVYTHSR